MDKLLVAALPKGDLLVDDDRYQIMFFNKLMIIKVLDILSIEIVDSLKKLNSLRNNCNHEQDYEIVEGDTDKLGRSFGTGYFKLKNDAADKKDLLFRTLMKIIAELDFEVDKYVQSKIT